MDLDQSGMSQEWVDVYLGPSVGWVRCPKQNTLAVIAAGTYTIDPAIALVTVNVAGSVMLILPSVALPAAGAQAQPGLFVKNPITIVDIGGNALSNPITIQRNNSGESIMGLTSVTIATAYGSRILQPEPANLTWTA